MYVYVGVYTKQISEKTMYIYIYIVHIDILYVYNITH